jgi:hypothetical protein
MTVMWLSSKMIEWWLWCAIGSRKTSESRQTPDRVGETPKKVNSGKLVSDPFRHPA